MMVRAFDWMLDRPHWVQEIVFHAVGFGIALPMCAAIMAFSCWLALL